MLSLTLKDCRRERRDFMGKALRKRKVRFSMKSLGKLIRISTQKGDMAKGNHIMKEVIKCPLKISIKGS